MVRALLFRNFPRSDLIEYYVRRQLPPAEVARLLGTSDKTIRRNLLMHGIVLRSRSEAALLALPVKYRITRAYFEREYLSRGRSVISISHELGIGRTRVALRLRQFGIPIRPHSAYTTGRPRPEEVRAKISQTLQNDRQRNHLIAIQRHLAKGRNVLESYVGELLRQAGIGAEWGRRLRPLQGTTHARHLADFSIPLEKVAIEVNGCFWHGCARCQRRTMSHPISIAAIRRDEEIAQILFDAGWSLIEVWEHELRTNTYRHFLSDRPPRRSARGPIPKELLEELYVRESLSANVISHLLEVHYHKVTDSLRAWSMHVRGLKESRALTSRHPRHLP